MCIVNAPDRHPGTATENDVVNGVCKPVTLIHARGTTETGNMGQTVGPALSMAMKAAFPNQVAVQGVDYPADIAGATSGALNPDAAQGAQDMASKAKMASANCPNTQIVLSGYSQGAEQVHGALANMPAGVAKVRQDGPGTVG